MEPRKVYYITNTMRFITATIQIIAVSLILLVLFEGPIIDEIGLSLDLDNLMYIAIAVAGLFFSYKMARKLYVLVRRNVSVVELHDTFLVVALHPGSRNAIAYQGLCGSYKYARIDFADIESAYIHKGSSFSWFTGSTFFRVSASGKKYEVPTWCGVIDKREYFDLRRELNNRNINARDMDK